MFSPLAVGPPLSMPLANWLRCWLEQEALYAEPVSLTRAEPRLVTLLLLSRALLLCGNEACSIRRTTHGRQPANPSRPHFYLTSPLSPPLSLSHFFCRHVQRPVLVRPCQHDLDTALCQQGQHLAFCEMGPRLHISGGQALRARGSVLQWCVSGAVCVCGRCV
jgi:hypothetical protein